MEIKKFLKYWWDYNSNPKNESSFVYHIVVVLILPALFCYALYLAWQIDSKKAKERKKEF